MTIDCGNDSGAARKYYRYQLLRVGQDRVFEGRTVQFVQDRVWGLSRGYVVQTLRGDVKCGLGAYGPVLGTT